MKKKECSYRVEGICRCSAAHLCGSTCCDSDMERCKYNGLIEKTTINDFASADVYKKSELTTKKHKD